MQHLLEITLRHRRNLGAILENMPKQQLFEIPSGYRNNVWWNIAHTVVTQQLLVYKLSGLEVRIPEAFIAKYKKGTVPEGEPTQEEIKEITELLCETITWTQEDYESGRFIRYKEYTTSAGVTLKNVDDALAFNLFHEGLHLGAIFSLRKMLT